jgi:hypothetical protein
MKPMKLTPAAGGWLHADWGDGSAWLRFDHSRDRDGLVRLGRIAEIRVKNPSQEGLRRVPLKRIEAAAGVSGDTYISGMLKSRIDKAPLPEVLDSPPTRELAKSLARRYRLKRPEGKRLDRDFYRDVARAYQSAVASGMNPRKAIVEDTGAADATAAGWVLEARKLGFLPKTTSGKVSA